MALPVLDRRAVAFGLITPALVGCGPAISKTAGTVPDDMTLGNPKAKVTVVEYASVACPICGRWYKEVYPAFKAKYIDTGKIFYISREMLVGGNGEVVAAASGFLLARCAGTKKYFEVIDAIYKSQPALFDDPKGVLLGVAKSVGINEEQFDACIRNEAALQSLSKRVETNSVQNKVNATPTFVINGKALEAGYHTLAELDDAIASAQRGPRA